MKPLSKFLVAVFAIAAVLLLIAAGPPNPLLNLRLDSDANGNHFSFTNLAGVGTAGLTVYQGNGSLLSGIVSTNSTNGSTINLTVISNFITSVEYVTNVQYVNNSYITNLSVISNFVAGTEYVTNISYVNNEYVTNITIFQNLTDVSAVPNDLAVWLAGGELGWTNSINAVIDGDAEYLTNVLLSAINPGSLTTGLIVSNSVSGGVSTLVLVPSPAGGFTGAAIPDGQTLVTNTGMGTWSVGSIAGSAIGSGTVATARLGSGSATSSTFLRGDQTWGTPAGGGGSFSGDPYRFTTNATGQVTLTNLPLLSLVIDAVTNLHLDPTGVVPCDIPLSNYLATLPTNVDSNVRIVFPSIPFTGAVYLFTNEVLIPAHFVPSTGIVKTVGRISFEGEACPWMFPGATNGVMFRLTSTTCTNFIGSAYFHPNPGRSNSTVLNIKGIDFAASTNSNFTSGLINTEDFEYFDIEDFCVWTGTYPNALTLPPYTNTIGINAPNNSSIDNCIIRNGVVCGFNKAIVMGSATTCENVILCGANYGFFGRGASILANPFRFHSIQMLGVEMPFGADSPTQIYGDAIIESVNVPNGWPAWEQQNFSVVDSGNLTGTIDFFWFDQTAAITEPMLTVAPGSGTNLVFKNFKGQNFQDYNGNTIIPQALGYYPPLTAQPIMPFMSGSLSNYVVPVFSTRFPYGSGLTVFFTNSFPWTLGAGTNGTVEVHYSMSGTSGDGTVQFYTVSPGIALFANVGGAGGSVVANILPVVAGAGAPTGFIPSADGNGFAIKCTFGSIGVAANATSTYNIICTRGK